ncbi:flavodoxin family protein [Mammaliicoccus sp. Dog046]|uniref:flavodoxin family protein n=1 Tax=Mammaliicoccus sp. Dog046 TaxID=3034233 RepID=UPI002B25C86E|nr:flavodoxin family protein [Mammaliicoccus sp. Dog046]WQK85214.1 flavodoxin family protein [Mammaliicoccus sp. Dog046]
MITCLLGSSRNNGNSNALAEKLLINTEHKMINLYDKKIDKVIDNRHSTEGFKNIHEDDYDNILDDVMDAETVVFATPLYWYSMSASLKLFIDRWTESLRDTNRPHFKEEMAKKEFIVIIVGGDNPAVKTKPLIDQFKYIFEFMNITNYSFIVGDAVKPLEIEKDVKTLEKINTLNQELVNRNK